MTKSRNDRSHLQCSLCSDLYALHCTVKIFATKAGLLNVKGRTAVRQRAATQGHVESVTADVDLDARSM